MEDRGLTPSGIALAVIVHGLLLLLLVIGVSWRSTPPQVVQAALWSEIPGPAVKPKKVPPPPTPEPKPKPVKVQSKPEPEPLPPKEINQKVEPVKKTPKVEKKQPEVQPEPKPVPQDKPKPPDKKAHQQAMSDIDRAMQEEAAQRDAQQAASKAAASKASAEINGYKSRVAALVRQRIAFDDANAPNFETEVEVTLLPTLEVIDTRIVKSSGNTTYDAAVERALKNFTLPQLPSGVPFERLVKFKFRLRE